MDKIEYMICETQQDIYKYAAEHGYDMEQFSDFFLCSDFCARAFDVLYSRFQLETAIECMDFILDESGTKLKKSKARRADKREADIAGFVGMIYRMLYFFTPYTSKDLCKKVPYSTIKKYYNPSCRGTEEHIAEDICTSLHLMVYSIALT